MSKTTQSSVSNEEPTEKIIFNPRVTVDLGIKEFKQLIDSRIRNGFVAKHYRNRLIKDFKKRQWAMYHEAFPYDNSSVPTHTHEGLDKLALV